MSRAIQLYVPCEPDVHWPLRYPSNGLRSRRLKRLTKSEMRIAALLFPERGYWRPLTRGDCSQVPRPCPYVGCKYHLYLDVQDSGNLRLGFDGEPWEMAESCALDVADNNPDGITLEETGKILGLTRERVRQLEGATAAKGFLQP